MSQNTSTSRARLGQATVLVLLALLCAGFWWMTDGPVEWTSDPIRLGFSAGLVLGFAAAWGLGAYFRRQKNVPIAIAATSPLPIFYASQTGFAEQLAHQAANALTEAGTPAQAISLEHLQAETLAQLPRALFIASTTGEGDAPDAVAGFVRRVLGSQISLSHLNMGVLALGDRHYDHFCGFGRRLETWLLTQGAHALFPRIEVDNANAASLRKWRDALTELSGSKQKLHFEEAHFDQWQVSQRQLLNSGSQGGPVFHVELQPISGTLPAWQAGDIAQIIPQQDPTYAALWLVEREIYPGTKITSELGEETLLAKLCRSEIPTNPSLPIDPQTFADQLIALTPRDYSIGSLPSDGHLDLLIRQGRRPDGSLGLAAGWLTEYAQLHQPFALRVRSNPNFHAPKNDVPIVLIGNGTGLASLRALLKERIEQGRFRNWLIFGERQSQFDFLYRSEILNAAEEGQLAHLDLAFSRDTQERIYVQHRLMEKASRLSQWIVDGAVIYVCGSQAGMAGGVDDALRQILGDEQVQALIEQGRYRRDVY